MQMIHPNRTFLLNQKKNDDEKFPIKFDIAMLNAMIGYIYKETSQVNRKCFLNMKRLFDKIDSDIYNANSKLSSRVYFINKSLEGIVEKGLDNRALVMNYATKVNQSEDIDEIINNMEVYKRLNYEEVNFITKAVEDRLKYINVFTYKDKIYDAVERLDRGDYNTVEEINEELVDICREVLQNHRNVQIMEDTDTFSLDEDTYESNVKKIVKRLTDETHILRTGIKCHNEILSGGYYGKRLYMYMALPANFKSGILLKAARDIKKYNKGIKTKTGKQPTVLLITCENNVDETIDRLFTMTSSNESIDKYSPAEAFRLLKEVGELEITDDNDINIVIKYFPNHAISTGDLYTIIDDLADEGKEVIALILDYIKRIRPEMWVKEEKEQLKNVTNELKTLATEYNIPVITAHQLNREAARSIDQAAQAGKTDLIKQVGRANVGSS